jgi:hypothetical protein
MSYGTELFRGKTHVKNTIAPAMLALTLVSCVAVVRRDGSNPPPPQPVHHPPPTAPKTVVSPWPPGAPPVPPGQPWYHDKLELKYDKDLESCYAASRKALVMFKFTEADLEKKTGELSGTVGTVYVNCTMYRKRHHTYLTFYFRVHGHRADARTPQDFARRSHEYVAKEVKEQGRKTD